MSALTRKDPLSHICRVTAATSASVAEFEIAVRFDTGVIAALFKEHFDARRVAEPPRPVADDADSVAHFTLAIDCIRVLNGRSVLPALLARLRALVVELDAW